MKALVGAFNQEKALVGAFSVILQPVVEPMENYTAQVLARVRCGEADGGDHEAGQGVAQDGEGGRPGPHGGGVVQEGVHLHHRNSSMSSCGSGLTFITISSCVNMVVTYRENTEASSMSLVTQHTGEFLSASTRV